MADPVVTPAVDPPEDLPAGPLPAGPITVGPVPVGAPPVGAPPVDPVEYRRAVGRFATGVTVLTTRADGVDHALTANSFTSVSLEPVLVLVSIDLTARFLRAVRTSGEWAVSVLAAGQEDHSRWFATHGRPDADQLAGFRWSRGPRTGAALFTGALATLECRTTATYDAGDHVLVVGEVLDVAAPTDPRPPLLYFSSRYRELPPQ